jgi:hypothetical protein
MEETGTLDTGRGHRKRKPTSAISLSFLPSVTASSNLDAVNTSIPAPHFVSSSLHSQIHKGTKYYLEAAVPYYEIEIMAGIVIPSPHFKKNLSNSNSNNNNNNNKFNKERVSHHNHHNNNNVNNINNNNFPFSSETSRSIDFIHFTPPPSFLFSDRPETIIAPNIGAGSAPMILANSVSSNLNNNNNNNVEISSQLYQTWNHTDHVSQSSNKESEPHSSLKDEENHHPNNVERFITQVLEM